MSGQTTFQRWDRALDWAGLVPSALLLLAFIRDYRHGGSFGWPLAGALVFLASLWPVYRGMSRRRRGAGRAS
ncbi:hypothetical protein ABZ461_23910 [Actinacidiphila glaucinigra]|uniref:hypothetical protein n=1 Tax=Actinacidiphila glaucinigra TaxID=235986 RepID=UPI00340389E9